MFIASNVENSSSQRTRFKWFFISWLHSNSAPGWKTQLPLFYRLIIGLPFECLHHCLHVIQSIPLWVNCRLYIFLQLQLYRLQVRFITCVPQFAQLKVCDRSSLLTSTDSTEYRHLAPNILGSLNFMGQGPTGEGIWSSNQLNHLYF